MKEENSKKQEAIHIINRYSKTLKEPLSLEQAQELVDLLADMRSKKFRYSDELSHHIMNHQLGYKYPTISGVLTMQRKSGEEFDFKGGFPPNIYAIICKELNLDNRRSDAKAKTFISFRDMENKATENLSSPAPPSFDTDIEF